MNRNKKDEELISLLKESGMEIPSRQFSDHLTEMVVQKYSGYRPVEYSAGRWLGKSILIVLVLFNLLFFYFLKPFSVQPVLFVSVAAFVLGLLGIILLIRKVQNHEAIGSATSNTVLPQP